MPPETALRRQVVPDGLRVARLHSAGFGSILLTTERRDGESPYTSLWHPHWSNPQAEQSAAPLCSGVDISSRSAYRQRRPIRQAASIRLVSNTTSACGESQ